MNSTEETLPFGDTPRNPHSVTLNDMNAGKATCLSARGLSARGPSARGPSARTIRQSAPPPCPALDRQAESPFLLENETAYRRWRAHKLARFATSCGNVATPVAVNDPAALSETQRAAITTRCRQCNIAFYTIEHNGEKAFDKNTFRSLCLQLGLRTPVTNPCADADAISSIRVVPGARYIPYTENCLKWHTDGYYNGAADTVRAFAMHCVRPARKGGENRFFDPEILYIFLRDENPDYITALTHPETLTVPQNSEEKSLADTRSRRSTPVLGVCATDGNLVMHYTQRSRHAVWRDDPLTVRARRFIREVLDSPGEYHIRYRLDRGEGVVCNNVIHDRSGFGDSPQPSQRLLYRARYRERIIDTGYTTLLRRHSETG